MADQFTTTQSFGAGKPQPSDDSANDQAVDHEEETTDTDQEGSEAEESEDED